MKGTTACERKVQGSKLIGTKVVLYKPHLFVSPMFKIGKLTDYATVLMTALAARPGVLRSAQELSLETHIAAPTVSKLLKKLSKAGLVESSRGATGGYRLSRPPEQTSIAQIVDAMEGPIAVTGCSVHGGGCNIQAHCGARTNWQLIGNTIREALDAVSLARMSQPGGLSHQPTEHPLQFIRAAKAEHHPG